MGRITKFKGIFVSNLTPFNESLNVDYNLLKKNTEFVIKKGVHGIVACGVNGEFSNLDLKERKKVIKTTVNVTSERVPVIASAYSTSTIEAIELVKYANQVGADAALLTTPFFFRRPSEEGLFNYFSEVLSAAPDFPIFLCNVPIYSLIDIKQSLIETLIEAHSNIVGIKDLSGKPENVTAFAGVFEDLSVLVGSDRLVFHGLNVGTDGAVSALASVFPEQVLKIYKEYRAGNIDQAWIEQEALTGIRALLKRFPSRAGLKFLTSAINGKESFVRPPLRNLSLDEKQALLAIMQDHGLLLEAEINC